MPARKLSQPDEKPQFERFLETARAIGAAETDDRLDALVRAIVKPKGANLTTPAISSKDES